MAACSRAATAILRGQDHTPPLKIEGKPAFLARLLHGAAQNAVGTVPLPGAAPVREFAMRSFWMCALFLVSTPAWCESIVDVLVRSSEMRLQARTPADPGSARAAMVQASWQRDRKSVV